MDRKTFSIGILSITACLLFIAQFMPLRTAHAATAVKDRDYQIVTARVQQGGEGLYITDQRTGQIAVFTWDVAARTVKLRAIRPVSEAFQP